jgi:hypothetical protein
MEAARVLSYLQDPFRCSLFLRTMLLCEMHNDQAFGPPSMDSLYAGGREPWSSLLASRTCQRSQVANVCPLLLTVYNRDSEFGSQNLGWRFR